MDQDLVSFVIRFVREASENQQARWRGVIKHVQSNSEASFTQFSEALAFMQGFTNDVVQESFAESKRIRDEVGAVNPFLETTRLWGDFMPAYTKSMMEAMGEAMENMGPGWGRGYGPPPGRGPGYGPGQGPRGGP